MSTGAAVYVHDVRVGTLWRLDEDENHRFDFSEGWCEDPMRPLLGQIFEDRRPKAILTSGLPSWFAHLLPQGPWARHLRRWAGLAEDCSDLDLLIAIGADLPGALSLHPMAPSLFSRRVARPVPTPGLRFSLAGAQWKLSVQRGERGLVVPVAGETGEMLAKFHDPEHPNLPRIEHATLQWARLSGIPVPEARLARVEEFAELPEGIPLGDGSVLLLDRYDRSPDGRVHSEELAQIADRTPGGQPGGQYDGTSEQLAALVGALAPQDGGDFLRRLVFAVLSGNGDAHWKNWSLVYPDRRKARLSPAYDLVPTILFPGLDGELALPVAGVKRFEQIGFETLASLHRSLGVSLQQASQALEEARESILSAWAKAKAHYTEAHRQRIEAHIGRVPLSRGR